MKPNDLSKQLKNNTGYSDADCAGDPLTRKSISCTLCYFDQFLLTSGCKGLGTVALSSGESELYALGALSAELIFAQAIMKEIGLSFLIHVKTDSSPARAVATKQGASRRNKRIHTRFLFIQGLVFQKLLTTSAIKTDVNPSDIGTKALELERFSRLRALPGLDDDLAETCSPGDWDVESLRVERMPSFCECSYLITSRDILGPSRTTEKSLSHLVRSTHLTRTRQYSDVHIPKVRLNSGSSCTR